jgi:hypothetical protein
MEGSAAHFSIFGLLLRNDLSFELLPFEIAPQTRRTALPVDPAT